MTGKTIHTHPALFVLCLCHPTAIIYALWRSKQLEGLAIDHLSGILPGMAFLFLQCVGMMLVRLDGSPRYAMWTQVAGAITNIVLDRLFIWFSSSLKFYCLKMSITSLPLTLCNIGNMAKIGFATFLTEIATEGLWLAIPVSELLTSLIIVSIHFRNKLFAHSLSRG